MAKQGVQSSGEPATAIVFLVKVRNRIVMATLDRDDADIFVNGFRQRTEGTGAEAGVYPISAAI
jgi:hypothetical protein